MYQTVGHELVPLIAEAMRLPLYRHIIQGGSTEVGSMYVATQGDEVEDLYALLLQVKEAHADVQAVSVGAILSDYQRVRVENVCARLGLACFAFLWRRSQCELLDEIIACGLHAIVTKVRWW